MALDSLWITVASLLAAFDITKAMGEDGKEIEPSGEYLSGLAWYVHISHASEAEYHTI
jgi:hypothetical protein